MGKARALALGPPVSPLAVLPREAEVFPEKKLPAYRAQDRARRIRLRHDRRAVRAKNPRLLASDGFAVGSKVVDMVDIDARQHCATGVEHVHRVESSAEPDFEDRRFDFRLRKNPERRQSPEFEIRQGRLAASALDRGESVNQDLIFGFAAGNAHPLVVADEVWRGVQPGARSAGAQNRLQHRAGGSLAVRAAHHDHGALQAHVHPVEHLLDSFQPERNGPGMLTLDQSEPLGEGLQAWASNIRRTVSMVSASSGRLSGRYPFTRAKRSAMPPG